MAEMFTPVLAIGCLVSLLVSGRLALRLVTDGVFSFMFIPVFEVTAFAILWMSIETRRGFTTDAAVFLSGNKPWKLWLLAMALAAACAKPVEVTRWTGPQRIWWMVASTIPFAVWSARLDYRFFRDAFRTTSSRAGTYVVVQRLISWSAAATYFFAGAIPPYFAGPTG